MTTIVPVILSGGSGTRLWPLSRTMRPKQFINLVDSKSLFQTTVKRIQNIDDIGDPIIVCNEAHRFMVAEQLQETESTHSAIILEPAGRNTAPAIAAAAYKLAQDGLEDVCMLVLPADHVIEDASEFVKSVTTGLHAANTNRLVTFGIKPDKPATGYGYIKVNDMDSDNGVVRKVDAFVEKPDLETATRYLKSGDYFWNGGMFLMKVSAFLNELETADPDMCDCVKKSVALAQSDLDFFRLDAESYEKCPNISIDNAVMEQSSRVSMVVLDAGWNDIGSWSSLWETGAQDDAGNVTKGDVWLESVTNSYVHSESRLLSAVGVKDLIVVETHDGVLIMAKSHDQDIKKIVTRLQQKNRPETELHRKAFRPWGDYDCLDKGDRFQVKRIMVKPGQCTSMQKHFHRAEHWIVVSGTAEVTCGEKTFILTENQSTFIPLGEKHRLHNPGTVPLDLIEVQSGTYLGEDDIQRIDDEYGRS